MFNFHKTSFSKSAVTRNKILLIESNGCHGEVISGYIKYFQNIGMDVDVLVTNVIYHEKPFCRLKVKNCFYSKFTKFNKLLTTQYLVNYKHIFIMSSVNYTNGIHAITDLFPDIKLHKSVYYVHHNTSYITKYFNDVKPNHNIMLGHFDNAIYINPHLFGKYTIPQKNDETIFISVGGINAKRKNHTALLDAIENLHNKGLRNFKVWVIGSGKLRHLKKSVKQHIKLFGHINYEQMFSLVEQAHFFLPLLDANNPDHIRYIKTQVTGSTQLIYGFRKIPVIHKKFAKFYGFNNTNSVIYDDLSDGMTAAILMTTKEYENHIHKLDNLATKIAIESQQNLKDILND